MLNGVGERTPVEYTQVGPDKNCPVSRKKSCKNFQLVCVTRTLQNKFLLHIDQKV